MATFGIKNFLTGQAAKIRAVLVNTDENIPAHNIQDSAGNEVFGATSDPTWDGSASPASGLPIFRYIGTKIEAVRALLATGITVGLPTGASTSAKQDIGNSSLATIAGKDFATQTTLAAVLAKLSADPATATAQATQHTDLVNLLTGIVLAAGTAVIGKVGIDQTTPGTTNKVFLTDINDAGHFEVAANQTDAAIGAGGGAVGDYLSSVVIVPAAVDCGAVSIKDGAGSSITLFPGGAGVNLYTLIPIEVGIGAVSGSGAWKVTTGANVSVILVGKFT